MTPPAKRPLGLFLAASILASGCGDQQNGPLDPSQPPPPVPTTLTVTPSVVEIRRLGETMQLIARVQDQHGQSIAATVTWISDDPAVATVDTDGLVTAVYNGRTTIRVSTGTLSASSAVRVDDPVAADYAPDRAALVAFFDEANGPNWAENSGWGEERVPMDEWYGVTTALDSAVGRYRVERLHLPDNNLRGTRLSMSLTQLSRLRAVDLLEAVWSEGPARGNTPEIFRCGLRVGQGFPLCQPDSAYPQELMDLPLLDSLRLGRDICVPAANTTLRNWLWSRDHYPYTADGRTQPFRKAKHCLGPDDVAEVRVALAQAVEVRDTLRAGHDVWIAARPRSKKRSRPPSFTDEEASYLVGNSWPAMRAETCMDAVCTTVDLVQNSPDSVAAMFRSEFRSFVASKSHPPSGDYWWSQGVAAAAIPGELIQPGVTITLTLESRTVGDTITIWQREITPVVLDELPQLEITLVAMVSPNPECARSAMDGNGKTENCYEWPDSTIVLDDLQGNEDHVLFGQLRHWFPTGEVDYRWHDELLESRVWDRVHSASEAGHDDLRRLRDMAKDDGRYWIGVGCLVGSRCNLGLGGHIGIAYLNGRFSVTVPYGPTLAHELGHNFGLVHPDEHESLPDDIEALAIGKWKRLDDEWQSFSLHDYLAEPVHAERPTFMHSWSSNRTAIDGEGIAPWQFHHILRRLNGTAPDIHGDRAIVVN